MGELLRRYWWPVAPQAELDERPTKAVRLMGEDLVLYRDKRGHYGLVGRFCPHRGASLVYGMVEECGLRCSYHGWMFNEEGLCTDQPFERTMRRKSSSRELRIAAYAVGVQAGILWAYLGPKPIPCLPDWDAYHARGYKQVMLTELPCNWLQCQENSIDPVHFEWLHHNWTYHQRGDGQRGPRHLKIRFDETEYGFVYRRVVEGTTEEDEPWTVGRVCLWPNGLFVGGFDWTVPIDDGHTLRIRWSVHPLPGSDPFEQATVPYWYGPLVNGETGEWHTTFGTNQDYVAMVSQGRVSDRTREHLGWSDRGVVMMRKRFLADLEAIAAGDDPKAVFRDHERNKRMPLPCMSAQRHLPSHVVPEPLAGQPQAILDEMKHLWTKYSDGARSPDPRTPRQGLA
jgi:5,5'-dehydrodivanillate O-demethylase